MKNLKRGCLLSIGNVYVNEIVIKLFDKSDPLKEQQCHFRDCICENYGLTVCLDTTEVVDLLMYGTVPIESLHPLSKFSPFVAL